MKVVVTSHYSGAEYVFEGSADTVYEQILEQFPFLHTGQAEHHGDVDGLVEHLNSMQALDAEVVDQGSNTLVKAEGNLLGDDLSEASEIAQDMLGFNPRTHAAFEAAKFLAGGRELPLSTIRRALYEHDGDYEVAALHAYGLPEDEGGIRALRSISMISDMAKAEAPIPVGGDIEPGTPGAEDAAAEVERAFQKQMVRPVSLGGKHSKGSFLAKDPRSGNVYLLKPGSGGQSPAAGAEQEHASQSRREAAFWHVAEAWALENSIPRADVVLVDGHEFAAIRLLPFSYKNLDKRQRQDPGAAARALAQYRDQGILHKWAVLDYILGNPDRHGQNLMIDKDDKVVALIDHGSAFAGDEFDPAYDKNSFVPFYLRAWAPTRFHNLSLKDKLDAMPEASGETRDLLRTWLSDIHSDRLESILHRFGIDPRPSLVRLAKLKMMAVDSPVDRAINRLWVTT